MINYFDLFDMPQSFRLDTAGLDSRYKALQAQWHPDRFAGAGDKQRLKALQHTSLVNDGYDTLRSPLKRAAHLLALQGVDAEEHNQAHFGAEFLHGQMLLREQLESLEDAQDMDALETLKRDVEQDRDKLLAEFEQAYLQEDYPAAKQLYNRLQFLFKLLVEIEAVEEKLLDY